jgi:hypothetical protein
VLRRHTRVAGFLDVRGKLGKARIKALLQRLPEEPKGI